MSKQTKITSEMEQTLTNTENIFLGSGNDCEIQIDDPSISLRHLGITNLGNNQFQIQDIDSDFGTFIQGKRILTPKIVSVSETIQIGMRPVPMSFIAKYFKKRGAKTQLHGTMMLSRHTLTVGREKPSDIIIDQPIISRKHLEIKLDVNGLFIRDLNSSNGTLVNNKRIESQWFYLAEEDKLLLGNYRVPKIEMLAWIDQLEGASNFYRKKKQISLDLSSDGSFIFGRDPDCDVPIDNPTISWHHAKLVIHGANWQIFDLYSSNGVFVDNIY